MAWFGILIAIVVAVAAIALTGVRQKGARPVGNTQLMTAARIVLIILAGVIAYWSTT